jgi:signal peptidase I
MILITFLVIRPLVYESFSIPTNGMAPTLLGEHLQLACPNCGSPAYGSPPDRRRHPESDEIKMICRKERRTVFLKNDSSPALPGDQITACKMITPRRWDIIVFRVPGDPSICYASRLVGLPNEELAIHDGAVWINGEKQILPDSIHAVPYSATVSLNGQESSGAGSSPVTLGSDEYFVLGDFPDNAFDSRFWKEGAPGHPPYAIPKPNIVGVVINVYWPPSRWTAFR